MSSKTGPHNIASTFLRLRGDVSVEPLPVDDGFWGRLASGALGTFHNEYLVSSHTFDSDWSVWEMHPNGDEVVCLIEGAVTFVLELEGGNREIDLDECGAYAIVPRGTWHTARASRPCRVLFITAGEGTRHRDAG